MNLENRVRLGYSYLMYLKDKKPEYAVTLTFRYPYNDEMSEMAMRTFVRKILTRLPRKTRANFQGLACAERHIDVKFDGSYHFHFLMWGLDTTMPCAHQWLSSNVTRAASELYPREASHLCDCAEAKRYKRPRTCKGGMSCRGPQMSGAKWVKVKAIDRTPEKAHEYVTSDIYRLDRPTGGQFLDIGSNGVTGHLLNRSIL